MVQHVEQLLQLLLAKHRQCPAKVSQKAPVMDGSCGMWFLAETASACLCAAEVLDQNLRLLILQRQRDLKGPHELA